LNLGAETPTACGPGSKRVTVSLTGLSSIMTVEPFGNPTTRMPPLSPDTTVPGASAPELSDTLDSLDLGGVGVDGDEGGADGAGGGVDAVGFTAAGDPPPRKDGVLAAVVSRSAVVSVATPAESSDTPGPGAKPRAL
jgi:hypothetical protein